MTGSIPTLGGGTGTSVTGLVTLGAPSLSLPPPVQQGKKEAEPSSIAVMTHEKRVYSNKVGHQDGIVLTSLVILHCAGDVQHGFLGAAARLLRPAARAAPAQPARPARH